MFWSSASVCICSQSTTNGPQCLHVITKVHTIIRNADTFHAEHLDVSKHFIRERFVVIIIDGGSVTVESRQSNSVQKDKLGTQAYISSLRCVYVSKCSTLLGSQKAWEHETIAQSPWQRQLSPWLMWTCSPHLTLGVKRLDRIARVTPAPSGC